MGRGLPLTCIPRAAFFTAADRTGRTSGRMRNAGGFGGSSAIRLPKAKLCYRATTLMFVSLTVSVLG